MTTLPCIMLVDDDQTTNFLNRALLTRLGVAEQLLVARDGQQALTNLAQHCSAPTGTASCPTLILLDVNMPGMNGVQFLQAYQQLPLARRQSTVIVMLTTSLHPRDVEQVARLAVVDGFVSKPLTVEKVRGILEAHFREDGRVAGSWEFERG